MNKKIIIIFALVLAVTVVFSVTAGAQAPTIAVSSAAAKPGDTVELKVSISGNPGINTFTLGFEYDTGRLTLQNVTVADALGGQFTYAKKAVWLNSSDSTYNGDILALTFKVNDNAPAGNASVKVTYSAGDISNYNGPGGNGCFFRHRRSSGPDDSGIFRLRKAWRYRRTQGVGIRQSRYQHLLARV